MVVYYTNMLNISLLREKSDFVKEKIALKGARPALVDVFLELDEKWRTATTALDEARAKQNELSKARDIEGGKKNKEKIKELELRLLDLEKERDIAWSEIPNSPDDDVPAGKDESENKVLRTW